MYGIMEYRIISGAVTEIRRAMMAYREDGQRVRRGTKAKKSSVKKILRNELNAVKALARTLNCNFVCGDLWLTLTFEGDIDWTTAQTVFDRFLRKLRTIYRRTRGTPLPYVYSCGRKSGELDARPHFHIVLPVMDYEEITALWPAGGVTYRRLDGRGDYTGVARYMISNARGEEGKKKYHPSRGLKKPVYTEPVPVYAYGKIRIPKDVSIREQTETRDEDTGFYTAYVRYVKKTIPQSAAQTAPFTQGSRERERKGNDARVSPRTDIDKCPKSGGVSR